MVILFVCARAKVTKRADTVCVVSARFFHAPKSFTGQQ